VKNNSDIMNTRQKSDKVHFNVSSYVNIQKCRHWAPNNPYELHQHLLHSAKVTSVV